MNTILDKFEQSAERVPDKIAFSDQNRQITFRQLRDEARRIAAGIVTCGFRREPIGVWAEHSVDTVVLFLAVLYSGNFYIPLDEEAPAERIRMMIDSSRMRLIVGCQEKSVNGVCCRTIEQLKRTAADMGELDSVRQAVLPVDPLYAVYTSGSTGVPKGVVKSHLAVESFVESFVKRFPIGSDEILGNQTPFYFDASAKDIYLGLTLGITVHIIDKKMFSVPLELVRCLNERRISMICWSPSALMILSQLNVFRAAVPLFLKRIFFVGEAFQPRQLARWRTALPEAEFVNLYGSSEIAGVCTSYEIPRDFGEEEIPLGRSMPGIEVFLMEKRGDTYARVEVPEQEGEICVRGSVLGLGYLNDPERTAETFMQNPFTDGYRDIIYRSGDLGKYDVRGDLHYISRKDFQIKHMGYRIELPEIEAACSRIAGVRKSACVYDAQRKWIVLFAESEPDGMLTPVGLMESLKQILPVYMVPRKIRIMPEIPMNANGKIDRVKLLEDAVSGGPAASARRN